MSHTEKLTELSQEHLTTLQSITARLIAINGSLFGSSSQQNESVDASRSGTYGFFNIQLHFHELYIKALTEISCEIKHIEEAIGIGNTLAGKSYGWEKNLEGDILAQVNENGLTKTYRSTPNANR